MSSASVAIVSALVSQLSAETIFRKVWNLGLKLYCTLFLQRFRLLSFAAETYMYLLLKVTHRPILSAEFYGLVPFSGTTSEG